MKVSKNRYLKVSWIWLFNCSILTAILIQPTYKALNTLNITMSLNFESVVKSILMSIIEILILFFLNFSVLKISKYISFKILRKQNKYFMIFLVFFIEMIILGILFATNLHLTIFAAIALFIYCFIVILQDYLFSKIYIKFNTIRVTIINSIAIIFTIQVLLIFRTLMKYT
ncbi:MAG: hypothetical protein ACRC41_02455 [Sarcina sp.]